MDRIIPESSINNITQRDEESSDKVEDSYRVNKNSDEKATILTMHKSRDGTVWSKRSSSSLQRCRSVGQIICGQGGATRFVLNRVDTLTDAFKEVLDKKYLLNIRKYTVAEGKWQGNNNFELSIDDLKAFLVYV